MRHDVVGSELPDGMTMWSLNGVEISARQEASSTTAGGGLERLTQVLVALTAVITISTIVLVVRGGG